MRSIVFLIALTVIALSIDQSSAAFDSRSKSQQLNDKNGFSRKKETDKVHDLYSRYQDWDEDWADEDMVQHPIDEAPRKAGRQAGEMCSYSQDCISGCCLLDRDTKIRSCQKKAIRGEKCTAAQVKGDLYVDACPCEHGDDFCAYPGEYCTK